MSQVIRISDDLYKRLESHASGFDSPSKVIEMILNDYEGIGLKPKSHNSLSEISLPSSLEKVFLPSSEVEFKEQLLRAKKAYIKLYFVDKPAELKEWNASKFSVKSNVNGNLHSGYLRNWKRRGIFKAEVAINKDELS